MAGDWDKLAAGYPLYFDRNSLKRALEIIREESGGFGTAADIGCGPGNSAIPLSGMFGKVYAVDSSRNMLDRLRHERSERGLDNIEIVESECLEVRLPERCDTVLSSLCPGMFSVEGMRKIEELSKDLCVYIGHAYDDRCTDFDMMRRIGLEFRPLHDSVDIVKEFSGEKDVEYEIVLDRSVSKDTESVMNRCIRISDGTPESEARIRDYFENHDASGMETVRGAIVAYWHKGRTGGM